MRKIILVLFILMYGFTVQAQLTGYTPVTDIAKFKDQFAAIAKKNRNHKK